MVLEVEDGVEHPLPSVPEFPEFQQGLRSWVSEPPNAGPATVIGNYQLFGQTRAAPQPRPIGGAVVSRPC